MTTIATDPTVGTPLPPAAITPCCLAPGCNKPVASSESAWHCDAHLREFLPLYKAYKAQQRRDRKWLEPEGLDMLTIEALLRGHDKVIEQWKRRTEYRARAFRPDAWDQGHDNFILELLRLDQVYVKELATRFEKQQQQQQLPDEGEEEQEDEQDEERQEQDGIAAAPAAMRKHNNGRHSELDFHRVCQAKEAAEKRLQEELAWSSHAVQDIIQSNLNEKALTVGLLEKAMVAFRAMYPFVPDELAAEALCLDLSYNSICSRVMSRHGFEVVEDSSARASNMCSTVYVFWPRTFIPRGKHCTLEEVAQCVFFNSSRSARDLIAVSDSLQAHDKALGVQHNTLVHEFFENHSRWHPTLQAFTMISLPPMDALCRWIDAGGEIYMSCDTLPFDYIRLKLEKFYDSDFPRKLGKDPANWRIAMPFRFMQHPRRTTPSIVISGYPIVYTPGSNRSRRLRKPARVK